MKYLTRDIRVTLLIKFSLLLLLWIVCFKGVKKPVENTTQWLLGAHTHNINLPNKGDL